MTPRRRAALVLSAAVASLWFLTILRLPAPEDLTWTALDRWHTEVGPAIVAMASLRLGAQVAAGWLVLVSAIQLVAAQAGRPGLTALADRLAPRCMRSVVCGAASLSLGAGLLGPAPALAAGPPPGTAVMVPLDVSTTTTSPSTTTTTTTVPSTTTVAPPAPAPAPSPAPAAPNHDEWVVRPGDSFWSIAEEESVAADVAGYWRRLIDANRDRLVDASNPDLIYPGQVLRLPAP